MEVAAGGCSSIITVIASRLKSAKVGDSFLKKSTLGPQRTMARDLHLVFSSPGFLLPEQ